MPWRHAKTDIGDVWEYEHYLEDGVIRSQIVTLLSGGYAVGGQKHYRDDTKASIVDIIGEVDTFDAAQRAAEEWIARVIMEKQ